MSESIKDDVQRTGERTVEDGGADGAPKGDGGEGDNART